VGKPNYINDKEENLRWFQII
jgi:hypothetical protein